MKTINVTFEDDEYKELKKKKGKHSWHDFIINNHLGATELNNRKDQQQKVK